MLSAEVDMVEVLGAEGDFTFCPSQSGDGDVAARTLTVESDGKRESFELDGGFVDVTPEGVWCWPRPFHRPKRFLIF